MHRKVLLFIILTISIISGINAQNEAAHPILNAVKIANSPDIDGYIHEQVWQETEIATNFMQKYPTTNIPALYKTEVRILYDDKAIYVGAEMFDPFPDSIKRELALRDNDDANADYFFIGFDTWQSRQDAYSFGVSASGVQIDFRTLDDTYDAVWSSAVKINPNGWSVEFRIPYSALRFPATAIQEWGMQIVRKVRRYRGEDQWALEPKDTDNTLKYWGTLKGLENINPPLRLSFMPYVSAGIQRNSDQANTKDSYSYNYNGGMDIKWGLNESFTLDMILMPDFSQVQSDEIEKNLSPFEIVYDENRPFFKEGTDLFQKGNLFYSRRIGHVPINYYSTYDSLRSDERITSNPGSSRLLNAVKVSGRTSNGLGIGVLNAITGNTYAVVTNNLNQKREILTDPVTNYNVTVLDQNLPNFSSVYLINTNVTRPDGWKKSNVFGGGGKFSEKSNTYQVKVDISLSNIDDPAIDQVKYDNKTGVYYNFEFQKTKGKFRFSLYQIRMDDNYNRNDLGVNNTNDWLDRGLTLGYNIFEPYGYFRNFSQSINFFREIRISTGKNQNTSLNYRFSTTLKNYLTFWGGASYAPFERYDYYEPRYPGKFWIMPGYISANLSFSSDYRKTLALDGDIEVSEDLGDTKWKYYRLQPILRISDRFKISPEFHFQTGRDDKGFASLAYDSVIGPGISVIFGNRDINTFITALSSEYMFNNKMSLSIWLRHYWQKGEYSEYYLLTDEGYLTDKLEYSGDHNYNYNSFNIDLVYGWEFSPGSMLNIVWKNALQEEDNNYKIGYFRNLEHMFNYPQINNLSVKILYYLDYQMLRKKQRR